jgi:hypothetical protein
LRRYLHPTLLATGEFAEMSEDARTPRTAASGSGAIAWWAHRSHGYVLATAGAASVGLGLSVALDPRLVGGAYLPPLLVALGAGALATVAARLLFRKTPVVAPAPPVERTEAEAWVICPSCNARGFDVVPSVPPAARARADPTIGSLSLGRSPLEEIPPGEFLWESWMPAAGRLPVDLVGPVPETVYVPHGPGAPAFRSEGDPTVVSFVAETVPEAPTSRPPAVEALRDATDRPERETPPPKPNSPDLPREYRRTRATPEPVPPPAQDAPVGERVLHEWWNPTPPHLRSAPSATPAPVTPPSLREVRHEGDVGRCATCDEPLRETRDWRRCTECQRLLCSRCMMSAFLTLERGWCSRCAEFRSFDTLSAELAPRPRKLAGGTLAPAPAASAALGPGDGLGTDRPDAGDDLTDRLQL